MNCQMSPPDHLGTDAQHLGTDAQQEEGQEHEMKNRRPMLRFALMMMLLFVSPLVWFLFWYLDDNPGTIDQWRHRWLVAMVIAVVTSVMVVLIAVVQ